MISQMSTVWKQRSQKSYKHQNQMKFLLCEAGSLTVPVVAEGAVCHAVVHGFVAEGSKVVALFDKGNSAGDVRAHLPPTGIH